MRKQVFAAAQAAFYFFFPEIEAAKIARQQKERLNKLFVVDNTLRNRASGKTVTVREVDCAGAMLEHSTGQYQRTDWITATGKIRGHVADQWDIVSPA